MSTDQPRQITPIQMDYEMPLDGDFRPIVTRVSQTREEVPAPKDSSAPASVEPSAPDEQTTEPTEPTAEELDLIAKEQEEAKEAEKAATPQPPSPPSAPSAPAVKATKKSSGATPTS